MTVEVGVGAVCAEVVGLAAGRVEGVIARTGAGGEENAEEELEQVR